MKIVLKQTIIYAFIFLLSSFTIANSQEAFDKSTFYKVMENASVEGIEKQIKLIEATPGINKEAYIGALLMKKAGIIKGASKKLNVFKDGHKRLEAAIEKDQQNTEWRFLRLIIQENAPKIVGYRSDIKNDAAFVHTNFKKLSPDVQAAVLDYRKHSNTLQPLNF